MTMSKDTFESICDELHVEQSSSYHMETSNEH